MTISDQLRKDGKKLVELYNSGMGTSAIAKLYNCTHPIVARVLKENGVVLQEKKIGLCESHKTEIIEMFNQGLSGREIGEKFGVWHVIVANNLKKWGYSTGWKKRMERNGRTQEVQKLIMSGLSIDEIVGKLEVGKTYTLDIIDDKTVEYVVDDDFFRVIDSFEKAYTLGFVLTDGFVSKNSWGIGICDFDVLQKIRKIVKSNRPITIRKKKIGKPAFTFSVPNKKMVADLAKYTVVENKTFTVKWPTYQSVPKEFSAGLCLGAIDGDGFYYKNSVGIVGMLDMCNGFARTIKDNLGVEVYVTKHKNIYQARVQKLKDIKIVIKWLYQDATVYMDRKYKRAMQILNDEVVTPY